MKRAGIAVGLIAAVAAVIALGQRGSAHRPSKEAAGAAPSTPGGSSAPAGAEPDRPDPAAVAPVTRTTVDRGRRAEIANAIAAARTRARTTGAIVPPAGAGLAGGGAGTPVDDTPGELTKDEIRTGVRDVIPMLVDCYSTEIERDPRLGGELRAHLTVDSEPDLGMVVTVGGLDIDGALGASTEFRDCVGATLESVVLPPLPVGGHVEITYPLAFSNDPDPADGSGGGGPGSAPAPSQRQRPGGPAPQLAQQAAAAPAPAELAP